VSLESVRRRLPIVDQLPKPKGVRKTLPLREGVIPKPVYAVWEYTMACDQRCIHCGPRSAKPRPDELSTEEALDVVDQLADLGVDEVTLIGGEAYLRNDFLLVIRRIRERGMIASLTTGGYNLTRARMEAMVEAGIMNVGISIDGLEASHDRVRNRPESFKRACAAMAEVTRTGTPMAVNSQINGINLGEHLELLEIIAEAGAHSWQLQFTIPHGNACDHPELWLQPWQITEFYDQLPAIIERARTLGVRLFPGNNLGYFGPLESQLRQGISATAHYQGCAAGNATIAIESDGAIKPCPTLGGPTNIAGNVREHSLKDLWERAPEMTYIRRRKKDSLWGFCGDCYYAEVCMGGCTATSEPLLGRPGNNPYCHHRVLELRKRGLRESLELATPAPDEPFAYATFRILTESLDEAERTKGPVEVTEPRPSRLEVELGPGA
jgi:radical SAM protein with 4Fe4S-binding SPASM domain